MKKLLLLVALLLVLILTACGQSDKSLPEETGAISAVAGQPEDVQAASTAEEIVPVPPPALSEEELDIPAPDFLNEEQQELYRYAQRFFHARWEFGFHDSALPSESEEQIELDGHHFFYSPVKGFYQNWKDFRGVMASVFTDELFDEMNTVSSEPLYIEYGGMTYGTDFAPLNVIWTEADDTFTLVNQTDDCVEFEITAYGAEPYEDDKITRTGFMQMIRIEDGTWRVAEFHCPDCPDDTIVSEKIDAPPEE